MVKKICLDAGHGGRDSGATFQDLEEADIVMDICSLTAVRFKNLGLEVVLTRDHDVFIPLSVRAAIANEAGVDLFISIHTNADPDEDSPGCPEAKGEEIWYYPGSSAGRMLASTFKDEVDQFFPDEPFRGLKEGRFTVLKRTLMPAILIETAFIDNSTTNRKFRDGETIFRISDLLAKGILPYVS
jgi:N-acetylmuramoyl-L-alanine amidase